MSDVTPIPRPSGILLAGGASRRFGRPKVVEPFDGVPLFHRPLRALVEGLDPEGLPEGVWARVDPQGGWRRDVDLPEDLSTGRR